jgi:uncharacterized protein
MVRLQDIRARDWSMMLDQSSKSRQLGSGWADVVTALEDINQCIAIICTTPKGSDPLRPTFACDIFAFLDRPVTLFLPHMVREMTEAITRWEPRVKLLKITGNVVQDQQGGGHVVASISWAVNVGGATPQVTIVTLPWVH